MVYPEELSPERRIIWSLHCLQRLLRMYGYEGDQDPVKRDALYHALAVREMEQVACWVPGQSVDFSRYDPFNVAASAYARRPRLCSIERVGSIDGAYAVGCRIDGQLIRYCLPRTSDSYHSPQVTTV